MFPNGETVTFEARIEDGAEDDHGNLVDTWADPVTVEGCGFAPQGSVESVEPGRNQVVTSPVLYCPPGTVVSSRDRATVRGKQYLVDGDPAEWRNPFTGWNAGVVVTLERVSG